MHPMFKELFIQTDADDLLTEKDRARRVSRTRRARSAMIIRPAARNGRRQPLALPATRQLCRQVARTSL